MRPPPRSTLFPYTTLFRSQPRVSIGLVKQTSAQAPLCHQLARRLQGLDKSSVRQEHNVTLFISSQCERMRDRKSTRLNSSHPSISYAVFCLKKKIILFVFS